MTVLLSDLFDVSDLDTAIYGGYVRVQTHPDFPLAVFTYTHKAMFEMHWNEVTRQCRGLIVNTGTTEVVARPFEKFFNYDEPWAPKGLENHKAYALDKIDGSLGIMYPTPGGGFAIATKGSFTSPQAIKGTEMLQSHLEKGFVPYPGITYLFEIVYPENRIVVDYGTQEKLVLLGVVSNNQGSSFLPNTAFEWNGEMASIVGHGTLADLLDNPAVTQRVNAEGVVVFFPTVGLRVKIKQPDYLAIHRAVFNLNEGRIWENLRDNTFAVLLSTLPEEHRAWAEQVANALIAESAARTDMIEDSWCLWVTEASDPTRKAFAEWVNRVATKSNAYGNWWKASMFRRFDNRDYQDIIWKDLKPRG